MEIDSIQTETMALELRAAAQQHVRFTPDGTPYAILPQGFSLKDLTSTLHSPTRKRGKVELHDAASFVSVVNDQKNDTTRVFSTINPPTFTAVFNHTASGAGWGDHVASYKAPLSPEWIIWTGANGKILGQAEIAQFLEANLIDVRALPPTPAIAATETTSFKPAHPGSPDGSLLLEICRTMQAKKNVEFKSGISLNNGSTQFQFDETVKGSSTTTAGTFEIPEQFSLGIPVFENGALYQVDVRLRYRIDSGGVKFWIELVRAHKVIEHAVRELREEIKQQTELEILTGTPSA